MAVGLTGGELALHEGWEQVAALARRRRMMVTLMTNGTLWDENDWQLVGSLRPRRVCISLYAANAEVHDAITGLDGSFRASVATLVGLRKHGVRCRIGSVLMPENLTEVPALRQLAERLECEFLFDPTVQPCDDGSKGVLAHRVNRDDLATFYSDQVIAARSREGRIVLSSGKPPTREPRNCGAGVTGAFVSASGDVAPCMGFTPPFGNIVTESFQRIWTGSRAQEHRRLMSLPLESCSACDIKDYCTTRCPRLALVEDGDLSGPSQRACDLAGLIKHLSQS
jgi:radical SAM protein with 4Fe4S-binding SPASM domain